MPDLLRLDGIQSLELPDNRECLVRARYAIHANVSLQRLFDLAGDEGWDCDHLAGALHDGLGALGTEVDPDVCRYLAQEFTARDKTKTLLVEADTGLAVAQVPEDAVYTPAPVPREGTDKLAVPLPRLKPEIEAAIIQHRYAVAEEPMVIAKLEQRARSTELQRAAGDARLRISTRSGRKKLAERLRCELPGLLLDHQGAVGRLFAQCRVNAPIPAECAMRVPVTLSGHASLLVADALAMNFHHDAYRAAREKIRAGWGRGLARTLALIAHQAGEPRKVTVGDPLPSGVLIGPPDLAAMARHLEVLPVPQVSAAVVSATMYLVINDTAYTFESYEAGARWCIDASVSAVLYLDTSVLHPLEFTDLIESGIVVEVL